MRFLRKIKALFFYLFYGMKSGEMMTTSSKSQDSLGANGIEETIKGGNLGDALIRGEVTQEVEELRYMDYAVSDKAKYYKVDEGGHAEKIHVDEVDMDNITISMRNKPICNSVIDELNRVDENKYSDELYTLKVSYDGFPRFKIEKYCDRFVFKRRAEYTIFYMYFDTSYNMSDLTSKPFINTLKSRPKDIFSEISSISFVTQNVFTEKDYVRYTVDNVELAEIAEEDGFIVAVMTVKHFDRDYLAEKYKSNTLEEKYRTKARKKGGDTANVFKQENDYHCDVCGGKIDSYDYQTTFFYYGKHLCPYCAENSEMNFVGHEKWKEEFEKEKNK